MIELNKIQFAEQKDDNQPGITHICGMLTIGVAGKVEDKTAPPRDAIHQNIRESIWNSVYGDLRQPMIDLISAESLCQNSEDKNRLREVITQFNKLLVLEKPVINGMQ